MTHVSVRRDLSAGDPADGIRSVAERHGATEPYSLRALLGGSRVTGAIWRGFDHRWEYNHRLNRFGSYVRQRAAGWAVGHAAASGTGSDTAQFEEFYTVVHTPGVRFEAGTVTVPIDGSEASRIPFEMDVHHRLDGPVDGDETVEVVLNGFDVSAQADADKLIHFDLTLGDLDVSDDRETASFTVDGSFKAACETPECSEEGVDYELDVHYLLVRGADDALTVADGGRAENAYEWGVGGEDEEIHAENYGQDSVIVDAVRGADPDNTLAFDSISIDVQQHERDGVGHPALANAEAVHLLAWNTAVESPSWAEGQLTADAHLFFKNWEYGMSSNNVFALRDAGRAEFDVSLTLLRFDGAETHDARSRDDTLDWEGGNADPNTDDAVVETGVGSE
ncbi:hypothetical protein [Halosimplex salinum]|uniref:hypothetical protein n=1 Tax=Halosimplex salinum TaxID=1710538 RepID=UPI000F46F35B|nr:hypothetical protein [Halosimplex salinum]